MVLDVASGFPALRESDDFISNHRLCPSDTMICHSAPTTTQLTSRVHKFPLTHEISLGNLSFFSGHPNRDFLGTSPRLTAGVVHLFFDQAVFCY